MGGSGRASRLWPAPCRRSASALPCVSSALADLSGPRLADRRRDARRALAGHPRPWPAFATGWCVRSRLLPRRPVLDRLRLPGRCRDVRLADAVRGARPARLSRALCRDRLAAGRVLLWTREGATRIVALAVGLTVGEWLRGHALTGFPGTLGYALTPSRRDRRKPHRSSAFGACGTVSGTTSTSPPSSTHWDEMSHISASASKACSTPHCHRPFRRPFTHAQAYSRCNHHRDGSRSRRRRRMSKRGA